MLYKLIAKQLHEITQMQKLNYCYDASYFKIENERIFDNDKIGSMTVMFTGTMYSITVEIDGHIEYWDRLSDVQTLYLMYVLKDSLKDFPFPYALKVMRRKYKETEKALRELMEENNENSTN